MSDRCERCGGRKDTIILAGGAQIYECTTCTTPEIQRAILKQQDGILGPLRPAGTADLYGVPRAEE